MNKLLHSNWVIALVGGVSYLLTTAALWKSPLVGTVAPETTRQRAAPAGPSWTFQNPEIDTLLQELKGERDQIGTERRKLEEWSARLQAERLELNSVTQLVHQMQMDLDKTVIRVKDEEKDNLKKLGKLYASMAPEGAAKIIHELEDEPAVKILYLMKESEAGLILEELAKDPVQAKRAAQISERLRLTLGKSVPAGNPKSK